MQAITQSSYGSADVLGRAEVDPPAIGADQVLVRVHAAGVGREVWHLMTGLPYPVRLAGYGLRAPKRPVPGGDVAGVVEAVGAAVTRFRPGDEVFGIATGSFAEYAPALERKLALKPARLSFEQAAALAISGLAALQAVRDHGKVAAGQRVLVVGASGGVGSYAVQIAKEFGAHVTGVSSAGKAELVASLGADEVLDYAREDFADQPGRYDVVLDIGGNTPLARLRRALKKHGRLVIVGGENGGRWLGGTDRQLRAMALSPFVPQKLGSFISSENDADLRVLAELAERGRLTPAVDRSFRLDEAAAAVRYVEQGRARGKVVLTVAG